MGSSASACPRFFFILAARSLRESIQSEGGIGGPDISPISQKAKGRKPEFLIVDTVFLNYGFRSPTTRPFFQPNEITAKQIARSAASQANETQRSTPRRTATGSPDRRNRAAVIRCMTCDAVNSTTKPILA